MLGGKAGISLVAFIALFACAFVAPKFSSAQDFKKNNQKKFIFTDPSIYEPNQNQPTVPIRVGIGIGDQYATPNNLMPLQRLQIREPMVNLCTKPIPPGGGNGGNGGGIINGKKAKIVARNAAIDARQAQESQVAPAAQAAIDSFQTQVTAYIAEMDGFYAAATLDDQKQKGDKLEQKKNKARGGKTKANSQAQIALPAPSATLNGLTDSLSADFDALSQFVDADMSALKAVGPPPPDPCTGMINSSEVYLSITSQKSIPYGFGHQARIGLDVGLYHNEARYINYAGGAAKFAAIPRATPSGPNLPVSDLTRSTQLVLNPAVAPAETADARFYFANRTVLTLGNLPPDYSSPYANGNLYNASYLDASTGGGLALNILNKRPVFIGGQFTEVAGKLSVESKFSIGSNFANDYVQGAQLDISAGGNSPVSMDSNKPLYISSSTAPKR